MDFHSWRTMYSLLKEKHKHLRKMEPPQFYRELEAKFTREKHYSDIASCYAEKWYYEYGKPYFKLWPRMGRELGEVSMTMPGQLLQVPFNAFTVRMPAKNNPLTDYSYKLPGTDINPSIKSLLVQRIDNNIDPRPGRQADEVGFGQNRLWSLIVHYQFDTEEHDDWCGWFFSMPVLQDVPLDTLIDITYNTCSSKFEGYNPPGEFCKRIVRTAIAVSFFGTNRHEMVMPDLPRDIVDRYAREYGVKVQEAADRLAFAKKSGLFGWRVGEEHEVSLPQAIVRQHDKEETPEDLKRELEAGHWRRPHMHMYKCGPKENPHYEFKYIPLLRVRPDLPLKEQATGFRITDKNIIKMQRAKREKST